MLPHDLHLSGPSVVEMSGGNVAYGELESRGGTLTGTLASGDTLVNEFVRSEGSHESITVLTAPEPSARLLRGLALALVLALPGLRRRR